MIYCFRIAEIEKILSEVDDTCFGMYSLSRKCFIINNFPIAQRRRTGISWSLRATHSVLSGILSLAFLDLNLPKLPVLEGTTPMTTLAAGTVRCWSGFIRIMTQKRLVSHPGEHSWKQWLWWTNYSLRSWQPIIKVCLSGCLCQTKLKILLSLVW